MAYTEKVSLSGTALSFLLYECINSENGQEGFLIGDVMSKITNHISDAQSDTARLDTQIVIKTVLPLPSASLFYLPTGRIKEDVLRELLSSSASEVVGWYKFRRNTSIKPTFRDKLIMKGLQKFFEKYHNSKNFVTCNLSNKASVSGSTHTFTYKFGKINCYNMYEYIEDVTANLGEKVTGYKRAYRSTQHGVFNEIVKKSNAQSNTTSDAILRIQEAVDVKLRQEAKRAAKNEDTIRELEAEIKEMTMILSKKHAANLQTTYNHILEKKLIENETEMVKACIDVMSTDIDNTNDYSYLLDADNQVFTNENMRDNPPEEPESRSRSPILISTIAPVNYAAALKRSTVNLGASNSKTNNMNDDLITFDDDSTPPSNNGALNDSRACLSEHSPEY